MVLLPLISCIGVTSMGSDVAPTTMSSPFGPRPSISSDIAFEFGAVATITRAPPSFCNASIAFDAWLSMYTLAPSFLARAAFSGPRPIAATLITKLVRKLNCHVTQAADALYRNQVARKRSTMPQRVVGGDSCA